jgi:hypothetical protein
MLTQEQVEQFHRDGFLNAGRILDHDQLDELSSDLDRVIAQGPDGFAADEPRPVSFRDLNAKGDGVTATPVWQIVNIWEAAQSFERLVRHPAIVTGISQLTGCGDLQVWHDQVQYKPAAIGGATGWHQDAPAWPTLEPMTQVSAWIPFDDAGLDNGCMWMVPRSANAGGVPADRGGLHASRGSRAGGDQAAAMPRAARRGPLSSRAHLARLAGELVAAPPPRGGDPLPDRSRPLYRTRPAPDGAVPGPATGCSDGRGRAALPDRLSRRGPGRRRPFPVTCPTAPGRESLTRRSALLGWCALRGGITLFGIGTLVVALR